MIHLLSVGPELTLKQLSKLSRRYAMTGGYELSLEEGLSTEDLSVLIERYIPVLEEYDKEEARYHSSNAYRILNLVSKHPQLSESQEAQLSSYLLELRDPASE